MGKGPLPSWALASGGSVGPSGPLVGQWGPLVGQWGTQMVSQWGPLLDQWGHLVYHWILYIVSEGLYGNQCSHLAGQ